MISAIRIWSTCPQRSLNELGLRTRMRPEIAFVRGSGVSEGVVNHCRPQAFRSRHVNHGMRIGTRFFVTWALKADDHPHTMIPCTSLFAEESRSMGCGTMTLSY